MNYQDFFCSKCGAYWQCEHRQQPEQPSALEKLQIQLRPEARASERKARALARRRKQQEAIKKLIDQYRGENGKP